MNNFLFVAAITDVNMVCPFPWHLFDGICYRQFNGNVQKSTFEEAKQVCRTHHSHLTSITSDEEIFALEKIR